VELVRATWLGGIREDIGVLSWTLKPWKNKGAVRTSRKKKPDTCRGTLSMGGGIKSRETPRIDKQLRTGVCYKMYGEWKVQNFRERKNPLGQAGFRQTTEDRSRAGGGKPQRV